MSFIVRGPNAVTIKGGSLHGLLPINVTESQVTLLQGVETPNIVQDDMLYSSFAGSTVVGEYVLSNPDGLNVSIGYKSTNEAVASVNDNRISYVADGMCNVIAYAHGYTARRIPIQMSQTTGVTTYDVKQYAEGSLLRHIYDVFASIVAGRDFSTSLSQWVISTSGDITNPTVTFNTDNIIAPHFDLSGVSVMSSVYPTEPTFPVALVTPRHALVAQHVAPTIGQQLVFRKLDGTYHVATVLARTQVSKPGVNISPDLCVVYLDADVIGCANYKTMPLTWLAQYAPSVSNGLTPRPGLPIMRVAMHDANKAWGSNLQITWISTIDETNGMLNNFQVNPEYTTNIPFVSWSTKLAIGGDSGGPSFTLVGGETVLMCLQQNKLGSANISSFVDTINEIMNAQAGTPAGTYELQHPELSGFTSYL